MTVRISITKVVLWLAAAVLVATPFGVSWRLHMRDNVPAQTRIKASTAVSSQLAAWRASGALLPARTAPVVLAYHDIRPDQSDQYVVPPAQFDLQMTALAAAGYHTITTAQYVDFLHGGQLPPRSVYLTFDDGTSGLWKYADQILARHRMHGASYLISGRVGTHKPYYLTWKEISRMADSGRWDFQAHTHDLHTRAAVGPQAVLGSVLTNRLYNSATGLESLDAFRSRVEGDFAALFADFAAHHLPRPQLFAYPFSELGFAEADSAAATITQQMIESQFVAALTNKARSPSPSSRRSAAANEIARIEIQKTTTVDQLMAEVTEWTQIPPQQTGTFNRPSLWRDKANEPMTTLEAFTGQYANSGYVYATYAPYSSADWTNYRVNTTVSRLTGPGAHVGLFLRVNGTRPIEVQVSAHEVLMRNGATVVGHANLPVAASHRVTVTVASSYTGVTVDGTVTLKVPSQPGAATTGGIGVGTFVSPPATQRPILTAPVIAPLP